MLLDMEMISQPEISKLLYFSNSWFQETLTMKKKFKLIISSLSFVTCTDYILTLCLLFITLQKVMEFKLLEKSIEKNAFGMNLLKLVICFQKQDSCFVEYNHSKQKMAKDNSWV